MTKLEAKFRPPHVYALYGDPAYPLCPHLLAPYEGVIITREQQLFNQGMSKVCVSVEWAFDKVVQYFAFLDFKKHLKSSSSANWEILCCGCNLNKLSHMYLWQCYINFFFMCHHPLSITVIHCHLPSFTAIHSHEPSFTVIYRYLL